MTRAELKQLLRERGESGTNPAIAAIFGITASAVSMWKDIPEIRFCELAAKRPDLAGVRVSPKFSEYIEHRLHKDCR